MPPLRPSPPRQPVQPAPPAPVLEGGANGVPSGRVTGVRGSRPPSPLRPRPPPTPAVGVLLSVSLPTDPLPPASPAADGTPSVHLMSGMLSVPAQPGAAPGARLAGQGPGAVNRVASTASPSFRSRMLRAAAHLFRSAPGTGGAGLPGQMTAEPSPRIRCPERGTGPAHRCRTEGGSWRDTPHGGSHTPCLNTKRCLGLDGTNAGAVHAVEQQARQMSGGVRQRPAAARTLLRRPRCAGFGGDLVSEPAPVRWADNPQTRGWGQGRGWLQAGGPARSRLAAQGSPLRLLDEDRVQGVARGRRATATGSCPRREGAETGVLREVPPGWTADRLARDPYRGARPKGLSPVCAGGGSGFGPVRPLTGGPAPPRGGATGVRRPGQEVISAVP